MRLSVVDDGSGVSAQARRRVFEPYFDVLIESQAGKGIAAGAV